LTPCWFGFVARGGHGGGSARVTPRGTGLVGTSTYVLLGGWEFGRSGSGSGSGSGSVQVQPACPGQRTSTSCTVLCGTVRVRLLAVDRHWLDSLI
jgi:hypothetical protein